MASHDLLLFIAMVLAKIYIELTGKFHETDPNMKIYLTGRDISLISDEERKLFNLTDENLKSAVKEYFGMEPNVVYLKRPSHWGDLHETVQRQPILRHLAPQNCRILNMTSRNVTILEQTFQNYAKTPVLYNIGVQKTVENIVRSSWENGSLAIIDDVSYDIDIESAGTKTAFGYTSKWGHDSEQGQFISLGKANLYISVEPYQVVTTKLQATKVDIIFEVQYKAFLTGYLVTSYGHKGQNFWALNIDVMERGNLNNELRAKEVVEFKFYVNPKIVVYDKDTRDKLMDVPC